MLNYVTKSLFNPLQPFFFSVCIVYSLLLTLVFSCYRCTIYIYTPDFVMFPFYDLISAYEEMCFSIAVILFLPMKCKNQT